MRYERRLVRDFQRCQREHPLWPVVVSEGDSWFSYPFARNLVDWLDDPRDSLAAADQQRWSLLRLERSGDEIMSILAGSQRASLREKLRRRPVEALLFSAGGNDLVGPDLLPLLRPFTAGMTAEECLVEARLERRVRQIRDCYLELVDLCAVARPGITIFTHGYDYPLPSGATYPNSTNAGPLAKEKCRESRHMWHPPGTRQATVASQPELAELS